MQNKMIQSLIAAYESVVEDYVESLSGVSDELFNKKLCKNGESLCSIKEVTLHVIKSAYTYLNYLNEYSKARIQIIFEADNDTIQTVSHASYELVEVFDFTKSTLEEMQGFTNEELKQITFDASWGLSYNFEQLLSHAIAHVIRHRLQFESMVNGALKLYRAF